MSSAPLIFVYKDPTDSKLRLWSNGCFFSFLIYQLHDHFDPGFTTSSSKHFAYTGRLNFLLGKCAHIFKLRLSSRLGTS